MFLAQNKYILNLIISTSKIKNIQNLPLIKNLTLKIYYKEKTIYLIMTTFFLFFFLCDIKPKLISTENSKKLLVYLNRTKSFKFLYNFYWLFYKYNNTQIIRYNLQNSKKTNVRIFIYTLQNIFFELFFFKKIQVGNWENLIFKLELLFNFSFKTLKKSNLIFFFKALKFVQIFK